MGFFGVVKSFARAIRRGVKVSDVKVNIGGGDLRLAEHGSAPGDDSVPLPGDYAVVVTIPRTGGVVTVAYIDPKADQQAEPGERRLYARKGDGSVAVQIFLRSDGSASLANAAGGLTLGADGTVTINGVTIDPAGIVTSPAGVTLDGHHHISAAPGSPTGPATP